MAAANRRALGDVSNQLGGQPTRQAGKEGIKCVSPHPLSVSIRPVACDA
jgi:hypothetical protein